VRRPLRLGLTSCPLRSTCDGFPDRNPSLVLRILRSAKDHTIKPFSRWWASLLAYLGRKLGEWRCSRSSRPGTFGNPKQTDPSSPGGGASSFLMSGGSVCLSGYAVAASAVPTLANQLEHAESQLSTTLPSPTRSLARLSVDPPRAPSPHPTFQLDANRSTGNLSTQSRDSALWYWMHVPLPYRGSLGPRLKRTSSLVFESSPY
jgi:hypothetical protein